MKKQTNYSRIVIGLCLAMLPVVSLGASDKTQAWLDILQSEAPMFQKARACQQLGESGTKEAVPVLASLLTDPRLSAYARTALERIPGPESSAALRDALGRVQGTLRIGVIHSLATLRDEQAVGALAGLTRSSDPEVVKAALLALGRIASNEARALVAQALTEGPAEYHDAAAAACLLGGGDQLKQGKLTSASTLYEAVLQANVPLSYHVGATRGAILSRRTDRTDFLVRQWRSDEQAIRDVAVLTVRENPSEVFAEALNAEIRVAPRDLQVLLIEAMIDCHTAESFPVIWAKVTSDEAPVRLAALKVLQNIGGPDSVPALLRALQENGDRDTVSLAVDILNRMEGPGIDGQILQALSAATESRVRVQLIGLLGKRSASDATDELMRQASGSDRAASIAACQALKSLAGLDTLPRLIELVKTCQDNAVREAGASTVYTVCKNNPSGDESAALVLDALVTATAAEEKAAWIRVLALLGCADALPAITATLGQADPALARSTISHLGRWPDPSPIPALFEVVEEGDGSADLQRRARLAILQLATAAADKDLAADRTLVTWFKRAGWAVQSVQEKRLLISGLGRVKHLESLQALSIYLDDTTVRMEAIHAILSVAGPLAKGPDYAAVESVLNRISGLEDARLLSQMADLKQDIKAAAARYGEMDRMIEQHRMGDLVIKAKPGARVFVEQTKHEFWFGAALSSSAFGGRMSAEAQRKYRDVFLSNFNAAVTENALKWHAMERRQGQIDYTVVDAMLEWTDAHDIPLRGHNIFWGIPGRVQDWLKALDDEALHDALKKRATTIARRYKGRFSEYDLNNEMIHGNYYADRLGPGITGQMVNWIKAEDPGAQLYLNDYDILTGKRLEDYMRHIRGFLDERVAIDGVGVQGHLHGDSFDPKTLRRSLDTLAEAGLPLCITEFNFPGQRSSVYQRRSVTLTAQQEKDKAEAIVDYYRICFAHPAVKGILMWGFWEGANWIPQSSLYRRDWTPTPAAEAYHNLIFNHWWTRWQGQVNHTGQCRVPAFFGTHRVIVNGREKIASLEQSKGAATVSFQ